MSDKHLNSYCLLAILRWFYFDRWSSRIVAMITLKWTCFSSKNKKCDQKIKTEVDHERKTQVKESGNDSEVFESSNQEDDVKKQPSDDEMKSDCESQRIQSKEVSPSKNGNLSEVFGNPTQSCDNIVEEKIDGKIDSCDNVSEEKVDDKPNIDEKIDEKHENDAKCTEESIDESKTFLFILVGISIIYKGNVV